MGDNAILDQKPDVGMEDSPGIELLLTVMVAVLGLFVGYGAGFLLIAFFYDSNITDVSKLIQYPYNNPSLKSSILLLQGASSACGFFLFPYLLAKKRKYLNLKDVFLIKPFPDKSTSQGLEKNPSDAMSGKLSETEPDLVVLAKRIYQNDFFLLSIITFVIMVISSSLGEWSQSIELPEVLSWLKSKDIDLERMTKYITSFDSVAYLLLCFVVIAGIAAVSEEFLFRGLLQKQFISITGSTNGGIWITAFFFSAMHMEFVGFLSRMFIGVILGYVYQWRKSLVFPIFIHFMHNGLTVLLLYLYQNRTIESDVEQMSIPFYFTFLSAIALAALLIYYKRLSSPTFEHDQVASGF